MLSSLSYETYKSNSEYAISTSASRASRLPWRASHLRSLQTSGACIPLCAPPHPLATRTHLAWKTWFRSTHGGLLVDRYGAYPARYAIMASFQGGTQPRASPLSLCGPSTYPSTWWLPLRAVRLAAFPGGSSTSTPSHPVSYTHLTLPTIYSV